MTDSTVSTRARRVASPINGAWRNAVFVVFAACGIAGASMAARIPAISLALHLTTAEVGLLLAGIAIGSISGLLASGHLVSHFGARRTILAAVLTFSIGLTVAAIAISVLGSFALAFAAMIVFGAAFGICDVAMNVSGAANERALGYSIMPVYHAFYSIGTIAGAGLGALAEALGIPLEYHIGAIAILAFVSVIFALRHFQPELTVNEHDEPHPPTTWRDRLSIWKQPRTIFIGLIVLGMAFTEGSSNDWLAYSSVHGHDTTRATGAVVYAVFVAAMTVGRLSGVKLLDRFGRVPVLRGTAALAAIGLLLYIFVPVFWIDIVGVVLWGLGASLGFPVGMSAAADDPRKAAATVSAVATIGYVAFLVGPPFIGFVGNQVGILNALLIVLVLAALAGVVSGAARKPAGVSETAPPIH